MAECSLSARGLRKGLGERLKLPVLQCPGLLPAARMRGPHEWSRVVKSMNSMGLRVQSRKCVNSMALQLLRVEFVNSMGLNSLIPSLPRGATIRRFELSTNLRTASTDWKAEGAGPCLMEGAAACCSRPASRICCGWRGGQHMWKMTRGPHAGAMEAAPLEAARTRLCQSEEEASHQLSFRTSGMSWRA